MHVPTRTGRGFTLVELMVVIAIIAILAAILIPNFMHARAQSATVGCEGNEKMIATGLEEYAVDHNGTYGSSGSVTSTLLGAPYLGITPHDPASGALYSVTVGPSGATYGSYEVTDAGGHDTTTTNALGGNPGGASIVYYQNAGIEAK